jgi:hypothetical protein
MKRFRGVDHYTVCLRKPRPLKIRTFGSFGSSTKRVWSATERTTSRPVSYRNIFLILKIKSRGHSRKIPVLYSREIRRSSPCLAVSSDGGEKRWRERSSGCYARGFSVLFKWGTLSPLSKVCYGLPKRASIALRY